MVDRTARILDLCSKSMCALRSGRIERGLRIFDEAIAVWKQAKFERSIEVLQFELRKEHEAISHTR